MWNFTHLLTKLQRRPLDGSTRFPTNRPFLCPEVRGILTIPSEPQLLLLSTTSYLDMHRPDPGAERLACDWWWRTCGTGCWRPFPAVPVASSSGGSTWSKCRHVAADLDHRPACSNLAAGSVDCRSGKWPKCTRAPFLGKLWRKRGNHRSVQTTVHLPPLPVNSIKITLTKWYANFHFNFNLRITVTLCNLWKIVDDTWRSPLKQQFTFYLNIINQNQVQSSLALLNLTQNEDISISTTNHQITISFYKLQISISPFHLLRNFKRYRIHENNLNNS